MPASPIAAPRRPRVRPAAARALRLLLRGTQLALAILGAVSWVVR